MLDRIKFWWKSVNAGVGQLYIAAGWIGLLVPLLGVAAGIAVPLVFNLSSWLTTVVLMGLLIVILLEGSYRVWHATEQRRDAALADRDAARGEIERRFGTIRNALQIIDFTYGSFLDSGTLGVQPVLEIKNNSDEYMRYEMESVSTVIADQRSANGPILTNSAIIPPHGTDRFTSPAVSGVPLNWRMGSLSLAIRYGHASGPLLYRIRREYALQAVTPGVPQGQINLVPTSAPDAEDI